MHLPPERFDIFSRISMFYLGISIPIIFIIFIPNRDKSIEYLGPVYYWFEMIVASLVGCIGAWVSIKFRTIGRHEKNMFFSFVDPTEKPDGIDCRFFRNNYYQLAEEPAAIFVDPKAHTILFENCYSSKGFFPVVQKSFKCHLLDILAVFPFKNTLTVVCRTGKAEIPEYATNFYALRQFLQTEVSSPETGSSRDNPLIGFAYAGGIFLGILGCLSLAGIIPNHFLPFLALLGGILGWFCCHMVVHFGDRFLKMDFSKPIGYGTIGGFSSIFVINIIGYLSQRFIWDISPLFYNTIILTFFSVGVIIGFYKRTVR